MLAASSKGVSGGGGMSLRGLPFGRDAYQQTECRGVLCHL